MTDTPQQSTVDVFYKKAPKSFVAKKRLGQNFLIDKHVIGNMISACAFTKEDIILEIGPGKGAITRLLAPMVKQVIAIEADEKLAETLRLEFTGSNVDIHQGDVLDLDLKLLPPRVKLFGNIPYNISTPIITWMLKNRPCFSVCYLTVQLEFAQRLSAGIKTKDRCPLACFIEAYTRMSTLFKIHPRSFQPMPNVMSCFIKFDINATPSVEIKDVPYFEKIVRESFLHRRKTLLNSLSQLISKERLNLVFVELGLSSQARAEDLTVNDFARLALLMQGCQEHGT